MALVWEATLKDGTEIPQYDLDGTENNIKTLFNNTQLDKFTIKHRGAIFPVFTLHLDESDKKLIYLRRTQMPWKWAKYGMVCHIVGWQKRNTDNQSLNFIFETDLQIGEERKTFVWIESTGKFDAGRHDWFYNMGDKHKQEMGVYEAGA